MDVQPDHLSRVIGGNIKRRRAEKGLTQTGLADAVGLTQSYISDLEAGKRNPRASTIAKIAEVLEVPPSHLMDCQPVTAV